MSRRNALFSACVLVFCCVFPMSAQQPESATNRSNVVVPPLVNFSGVLTDVNGKPLTHITGVTFLLYKDEQGGAPLWTETQNVYPDKTGHYSVMLGSTTSAGLPADIFVAGEARWLGVQEQGQAEQPRILLLSVPYALKAADAQTVGGLPASAFVLAAPPAASNASAASPSAVAQPLAPGTTPVTTAGGTVNKLAKFDATADITSSQIFDNGTNIGIGNTAPAAKLDVTGAATVRGLLSLPATGTATATAGKNSQQIGWTASAFNSGTATAVNQNFRWQAEPLGNNTATASGTLNLLYATGTATPAETGLKITSNGRITFAAGQTFPGTGNGSVTSVGAGLGLTGGPITTSGTLAINTAVVPQLKANNSFTGTQSITGSLGINTTAPAQSLEVDSGNVMVKGPGNFKGAGNTAFLYVGDTSHPIEAIWNTGLAIGAYLVPTALFIQDQTGRVGIGTTAPAATLNVVSSSASGVGVFGSASATSSNTIGVKGQVNSPTGIAGDFEGGGDAVVAHGGDEGGIGVNANGGSSPLSFLGGGSGVQATGGDNTAGFGIGGFGVDAQGGFGWNGGTGGMGVLTSGGNANGAGSVGGDAIFANGGSGDSGNGLAGSFYGDVSINGNFTVSGTKSFRIDHPIDPANKYLYHAALESSEVLNLYTGNSILDANGEATVQFPDWFEALNKDFRYQLTAIGAPAPNLHIAQKIQNHSLRIAGGSAGLEVSWQVTGVRQDAWERAHPMAVEVAKPPNERGYYINPDLFDAPPEKGIEWARHPQLMKKIQEVRAQQLATAQKQTAPRN